MAKYIIEVPDNTQWIQWMNVSEKDGSACFDYKAPEDLTPYTEQDQEAIEDEVWEFTGKIQKMTCEQMHEVFGITAPNYDYFCNEISYQEAKSKYESWKAEKAKIRVGDEVEYECDGIVRFVVFGIVGNMAYGFKYPCDYDDVGEYCDIDMLKKTGRHFNSVEKLLEEMRSDSHEHH